MNTKIVGHARSQPARVESRLRRIAVGPLAGLGFVALLAVSTSALAQTAPSLGSLTPFGVVSSTYTNTAAGTVINGNLCFTTGPAVAPVVTGTTGACPASAGADQNLALATINGQACVSLGAGAITLNTVIIGANPPGVIPPGCYSSGGAMDITATTTVTLNGAGVYIFRPGGALTTGANSRVILAGGACASDVFWAPVGATTIGANAAVSPTPTFVGTIFRGAAAGLSITLGQFANLNGRALAFGSTVTTDANTISVPTCAPFGAVPVPTLSEWAMIMLAGLMAFAGFAALRRQEK